MTGSDDWEEQMIRQMTDMFKQMGFPVDKEQIRQMIEQFREQFEEMGLDPEKLSGGGVNLNIDISKFSEILSGGGNIKDILKGMGMEVEVDASPVEIETPEDDDDEEVKELPAADVYLDGWMMNVTLDCSMQDELDEDNIELELVSEGEQLEVMRATQVRPVARVNLPHPCEELVEWSLNNGILDLTFRLIPQGSALSPEDDPTEDDDDEPEAPEVSIDISDDDDDENDGGIPIL
mgnify:CR=1 FL=1